MDSTPTVDAGKLKIHAVGHAAADKNRAASSEGKAGDNVVHLSGSGAKLSVF
jgi:hypothetical protein